MKLFRSFGYLMLAIGTSTAVGYGQSGPTEPAASGVSGNLAQASAGTLPKDVHPDSRNRLPLIQREELDDAGKKVYDEALADSRSLVGLQGPTGIRLHSPRLAEYMRPGSQYLRFDTNLSPRLTQLATLVTARELDQQFEWTAHEPAALKAGLEQEIIDIVKYRKALTGLGEKEAVIIQLGREVLGKHRVSSDTFARALKLFGKKDLVDLVSLMGQYAATAVLLTTFDQQISLDQKPLLPIP